MQETNKKVEGGEVAINQAKKLKAHPLRRDAGAIIPKICLFFFFLFPLDDEMLFL